MRVFRWLRLNRSKQKPSQDKDFRDEIHGYFEGIPQATGINSKRNSCDDPYGTRTSQTPFRQRAFLTIQAFFHDIRFGARLLRKNLGFSAVAIATLALGIGVNAAIFSTVYAVVMKQLPYPRSSQLIELRAGRQKPVPFRGKFLSDPAMDDVSDQLKSVSQIARYMQVAVVLIDQQTPESLTGMIVSGGFFSTYDVRPLVGRPVLPADTTPGNEHVVVLSYDLWKRSFSGDQGVIGRQIELVVQPAYSFGSHALKGKPYTVIGIMPPNQQFPVRSDLWIPFIQGAFAVVMGGSPRASRGVSAVARVKDGVALDQVNTELHTIASRLASEYPATDGGWDLSALLLRDAISENYKIALRVLWGAVTFVLLLACGSVSSMVVAKNRTRKQEVAIRKTLGASRGRIIQQFLAESILLGLVGGGFGLLVAIWSMHLLKTYAPVGTPRLDEITMNGFVLSYTFLVSVIVSVLFGLTPALKLTRTELGSALKEKKADTRSGTSTLHGLIRLRGVLIGFQLALVFPLVVGSVLAVRSFDRLAHVDLGFRRDHILTMYVKLSTLSCGNVDSCSIAVNDLVRRLRSLPGVDNAAISATRPLGLPFSVPGVRVEGDPDPSHANPVQPLYQIITPGYFLTMGIPLRMGRTFSDDDIKDSTAVAIVNETMARQVFKGDPIGKRFSMGQAATSNWLLVVGEVNDARELNPSRIPVPAFYVPTTQARAIPRTSILVRTMVNPQSVLSAVEQQIRAVDKNAPITDLQTMDQIVAEKVAESRFQTWLLTAFAALGLLLGLLGIYGLISYSVSQRTHEFGIRMALGAQSTDILHLVLGESIAAIGWGLAIGVCGALSLTRFLQSLLFEIKPTDPLTFAGVAVLIAAVALCAYYIPARRATRVDPMIVLREE
jgi:predicted permease